MIQMSPTFRHGCSGGDMRAATLLAWRLGEDVDPWRICRNKSDLKDLSVNECKLVQMIMNS